MLEGYTFRRSTVVNDATIIVVETFPDYNSPFDGLRKSYKHTIDQCWIKTKSGLMLLPRKGPIFFSAFKTDQDP